MNEETKNDLVITGTGLNRALSLWQFAFGMVGLGLTIAGIAASMYTGFRTEMSEMRMDQIRQTMRISALENKATYYDRLIEERNAQNATTVQTINDTRGDLASLRSLVQRVIDERRR